MTPISDLGHFNLLNRISNNFNNHQPNTHLGMGDDAAVIDNGNNFTLLSTDLLVEGVHFNLTYTPLRHLGYKTVITGISDIYAMNGMPQQITVSIALSARLGIEHVDELYAGIKLACEQYRVDLVGGDTSSSLTGLIISVTAMGNVDKDKIAYRKGAQENDLICVSGNLGAAYMGLQLLERERRIFEAGSNVQPVLEDYQYILERQLKPEAPKNAVNLLAELKLVPTAMIDITDGLASELLHICSQSQTGCTIYQGKIPIDAEAARMADELNTTPLIAALNGGDDYELLFTLPIAHFETIAPRSEITIIGHITDIGRGRRIIFDGGEEGEISAQGWK